MTISNMTNTRNSVRSFAIITDNTYPDENCAALDITVRDSVVTENMLDRHPTLPSASVLFWSISAQFTIEITFDNVSFSNSNCVSVYLWNVQMVTFINCTFENNQDTAIKAVGSNLAFGGNNTFRNNSAVSGAGITLLQNSYT